MDGDGVLLQPLKSPGDVWAAVGEVELLTSSTVLHKATDAFIYLVRTPPPAGRPRAGKVVEKGRL